MAEETIPQMRERIEQLEKQLSTEQKARTKAEADVRLYTAKDAFRAAKLPEAQAELFAKAHDGDITEDAVKEFAQKFGLTAAEAAKAEGATSGGSTTPPASGENLKGMSRAGTGAGEGGASSTGDDPMPRSEWMELNQRDPEAARAKLREGNVALRADNPFAVRR